MQACHPDDYERSVDELRKITICRTHTHRTLPGRTLPHGSHFEHVQPLGQLHRKIAPGHPLSWRAEGLCGRRPPDLVTEHSSCVHDSYFESQFATDRNNDVCYLRLSAELARSSLYCKSFSFRSSGTLKTTFSMDFPTYIPQLIAE